MTDNTRKRIEKARQAVHTTEWEGALEDKFGPKIDALIAEYSPSRREAILAISRIINAKVRQLPGYDDDNE